MANYIDKEIICEAYSHLEVETYKDKEALDKLRAELLVFYRERAKFLFGEDVEVEIEFADGSLITKLRVIGSTVLILTTLTADYGSFRQGVDQVARDSSLLAQSTNLEVIFRTRANYCDRVAIENRKGIFGRTQELIHGLDSIKYKTDSKDIPTNKISLELFNKGTDELINWDTKADKLFAKITSSETTVCVASGLAEELKKLPSTALWEAELKQPSFRTTLINSDPELASAVNAAAYRYSAALRAVNKKIADRIMQNTNKAS